MNNTSSLAFCPLYAHSFIFPASSPTTSKPKMTNNPSVSHVTLKEERISAYSKTINDKDKSNEDLIEETNSDQSEDYFDEKRLVVPSLLQTTLIKSTIHEVEADLNPFKFNASSTSPMSPTSPMTPMSAMPPSTEFSRNPHKHQRRRKSIANTVIDGSLAPSLLGISTDLAKSLMDIDPRRCSMSTREELCLLACRRKSLLPFLRLHMPQPHSWVKLCENTNPDSIDQLHQD